MYTMGDFKFWFGVGVGVNTNTGVITTPNYSSSIHFFVMHKQLFP